MPERFPAPMAGPSRSVTLRAARLGLAFVLGASGCAHNREARLADQLAGIWLESPGDDGREPLVVCGISIPENKETVATGRSVSEKMENTGRVLLRDALSRVRVEGNKTINYILAHGSDALTIAQAAITLSRVVFAQFPARTECDEYDVAAIKDRVLQVEGFLAEVNAYEGFLKKFDGNNSAHRTYLVAELSRLLNKADRLEKDDDIQRTASTWRRMDREVLETCRERLDAFEDCDIRVENDRRKRNGEELLDRDAILFARQKEVASREEDVRGRESALRFYERNGDRTRADFEKYWLRKMGVWDAACGCVSPNFRDVLRKQVQEEAIARAQR